MKVICSCCSRQIVDYNVKPDNYVTNRPATRLVGNTYCCAECSEDLDENGMFPEEAAQLWK